MSESDGNGFDWTRPLRWAQLTLVENDPGDFDLDFWLDYFGRVRAQGACLSAGGYIAYYPTEIPLHYRSAWLGDSDPFGDLVAGCRKMDMVVLARTDPHAVHEDVYAAHPDWIAVDTDGKPRRHWSKPDAWVTCALGPYNYEFMTEVHKEIVARYGVDGIFSNRWAGHGICYCEHCRRNFREASGMDLPRIQDPGDASWRAYMAWRQARLFEVADRWDRAIREIEPHARYIPNSGGGALSSLDMVALSNRVPLLFADRQGRQGAMAPWAIGKNAKEYRAVFGRKPIGGIFSVGLTGKYRWKDSVQHGPELRVWVADAIANGMRPWFTKFSGQIYDDRWLGVVAEMFQWHAQHERYWRETVPAARVAVVYSQQTAAHYGGPEAPAKVEDPILGVYQALIEARIPFEMVHDGLLDPEHVDQYKTLVLPNIAALSDEQCNQLRGFVGRGGSLLATFETSLYDEAGRRRDNFGLADLFGVDFDGQVEGPLKNAYLWLEHDSEVAPDLLAGMEDAQRIVYGGYRVHVTPCDAMLSPPLTLVPPYPDLPMEEVYPRAPHTAIPGLICRHTAGGGRVIYAPWDLARIFWEVLSVDHAKVLANAVRWVTDEALPVEVKGPGVLDVTVWQRSDAVVVHLVNLANPMMMHGAIRELIPAGPQEVAVRLPAESQVRGVHLLKAGRAATDYEVDGDLLTLTVPEVWDHEVVAIDLMLDTG
ncbi:MAG: alpha-amylase family protein [Anaerolineae bacterium]